MNKNKSNLEFDYIIIGSGAAGSTLAYELSKDRKKTIAIVDIGKTIKPKKKRQFKAPFLNQCTRSYTHSISGVFGGATELWSSKIYLLTKGEIGSWPISYKDLLENSKDLANELGIDHKELCFHESIDEKAFYHRAKRSTLGNLFDYFQIGKKENISCFEDSTLVDIEYNNESSSLNSIYIEDKSSYQQKIKVNKSLIFCAGGLGNLSLYKKAIEKFFGPEEIPKIFPIVDHPHITIGRINNKSIPKLNRFKDVEDCIFVKGESNTYAFQTTAPYLGDKFFRRLEKRFEDTKISYILLFLISKFERFFLRYKRYFLILTGQINRHNTGSIEAWFEETVDYKSTVSFSDKNWFNGKLSKLNVHYNYERPNYKNLKKELDKYTKSNLYKFNKNQLDESNIYSGLKPSCSTPMKSNPFPGEVSSDCNIMGIKNLFMIGTNIYPTIGVTNPTWTLMVLSKRLSKII